MDQTPGDDPGEVGPIQLFAGNNARYAMAGGLLLALAVIIAVVVNGNQGGPAPVATPTTVAVPTASATPAPTQTATPTAVPTATAVPAGFAPKFSFQPLAVMIENHFDARPQSGLSNADVVYEALVEGWITRFMAIYANHEAEVVGPVRSARHYYVYWASEYNAIYAHCGSSPQGYAALDAVGLTSLDDTYGTGSFWRSDDRVAPHNLYASTEALRDSTDDSGEGWLGGLRFLTSEAIAEKDVISEVKVTHPDGYYVLYTYSEEDNAYWREMEGYPHVDAWSGLQYEPKNVLVQFVETWPIPGDEAGRLDMTLVGQGEAYAFTGGKVTKGTWIKESLTAPTRYVDGEGRDILLNPGQTWIQVVPDGSRLSYK